MEGPVVGGWGDYKHFGKGGACPLCFLRFCQVFPGSGSLNPTLWWKVCFPVNTGTTHCHQKGTWGHPLPRGQVPWDLYPSCLATSLCPLP